MGVGLYLVWPAFYCDVTDAYRLGRVGRLRTDLGGVYFNAIFALLAGGVYFATGEEAALLAASVQYVIILQQLLPLLRFDGYYVLSDLTGVPDILSRIKPIFRSLLRPRRPEPAVAELKPWVRAVVTVYLIVLVPELILLVASMVMGAPRMLATTYDSLGLQLDRLSTASGPAEAGLRGFQIIALVMPVAATSVSLGRTGKRAGRGVYGWASVSRAADRRGADRRPRRARHDDLHPAPERRLRADPARRARHARLGRAQPAGGHRRPPRLHARARDAGRPAPDRARAPLAGRVPARARAPADRGAATGRDEDRGQDRPAAAPRRSSPTSRTARRVPPPGRRPPPRRPRPPPPLPPPPPLRPPRPRRRPRRRRTSRRP